MLSPMKAIKKYCQRCMGTSRTGSAIKNCEDLECPLYTFRLGKNPNSNRKGRIFTEEEKEQARQRLIAYHAKKKSSVTTVN